MKKYYFLFLVCVIFLKFNVFANQSCLILLDHHDTENIGRTATFYLNSKLQSAIAEKSIPILMHSSLWNSFLERRAYFEQYSQQKDTKEHKLLTLYETIRNKIIFWSSYYNKANNDIMQNKMLVVQRTNEEFYNDADEVTDLDYQLLLNCLTPFNPDDWVVYKKSGFFLFIPKNYLANYPKSGFNIENLEHIGSHQDIALNYFESQKASSLAKVIPDFFSSFNANDQDKWNIVLSGHGGSFYTEINDDKKVSWNGEPLIADLTLQEFKDVLGFFETQLNTHMLHYSSCYAGGNHIELAFEKPYNFAIICECLTDCAIYCKWTNTLPSKQKKILTVDDLHYDSKLKSWDLNMKSPYRWNKFFSSISKIDFSLETIEYLPKALTYITYPIIANISLLRRPGINQFYPVTSADTLKIDDQFVLFETKNETNNDFMINGINTLLLQKDFLDCSLTLNNTEFLRIISIKPGKAQHYIKKLILENPVDLPSVFWQAEFQIYDKVFLIDECNFPFLEDSLAFSNLKLEKNSISIEKVMIKQQNTFFGHFIRLFFTLDDKAMMIVAKKIDPYELDKNTTTQEIITLSSEAKLEYEKSYACLKASFNYK